MHRCSDNAVVQRARQRGQPEFGPDPVASRSVLLLKPVSRATASLAAMESRARSAERSVSSACAFSLGKVDGSNTRLGAGPARADPECPGRLRGASTKRNQTRSQSPSRLVIRFCRDQGTIGFRVEAICRPADRPECLPAPSRPSARVASGSLIHRNRSLTGRAKQLVEVGCFESALAERVDGRIGEHQECPLEGVYGRLVLGHV